MKCLGRVVAVAAVLVASTNTAHAQLIDFNALPSSTNPIYSGLTEQGFNFTGGHFHLIGTPLAYDNGTVHLATEGNGLGTPVTMAPQFGGTFSLNSFDGGGVFGPGSTNGYPDALFINLLANVFGGGTLSASFAIVPIAFTNYLLPSTWTNLTDVTFSGWDGAQNMNAGFSIDNIQVNAVVATPEPASVVLLATGFLGIAAFARRRRAA